MWLGGLVQKWLEISLTFCEQEISINFNENYFNGLIKFQ